MLKKITSIIGIISMIAVATFIILLNQGNGLSNKKLFEVKAGQSLNTITRNLHTQGLIKSKNIFKAYVRLINKSALLKTGEYTIPPNATAQEVVALLLSGQSRQYSFTIVEGSPLKDVINAIKKADNIKKTTGLENHQNILQLIAAAEKHPEGLFLADTYYYTKNTSAEKILQRSYQAMQKFLQKAWSERDKNSPIKTPYEALILASIIEKETAIVSERKTIAGVFINRLRKGMRLQTDPTVIYGIGESYDGDIKYKDLRTDTPYNTYTRYGLPPTPIAMSGKDAILAALHPEKTKALYFVASGDGGHTFSKTLQEHEAAVKNYLKKTK